MRHEGLTQQNLALTRNLIMLEKGREELLLVNSVEFRPLYIKRGRDYIKKFLEAVPGLGAVESIKREFPADRELLNLLMDHRIITYAGEDHPGPDKPDISFDVKAREEKSGMSLYLLLSQSCNLGCIYCLNGIKTYSKDKNLKMKEEVAYKSVERCLDSLSSGGKLEIVFFGGEPLLNWPLAKKVITYCENNLVEKNKDKEIRYHITSNLTILPSDLIEWAKRYNITFLCDIDGPEDIHNECRPYKNGKPTHGRIVKNIDRLTGAGLQVALRATMTRKNHGCMLEIARHHKELGGIGCAFVPVNPVNSDEDILPETLMPSIRQMVRGLAQVYKSKVWDTENLFPFNVYATHLRAGGRAVTGCGAPYGNTPVVDVNGDVYPCIYLVGIKRFYLGNILQGNYPDNKVLDWMMDFLHVDHIEECKVCAWRYICGGGCPVGKLTVFENPLASRKTVKYCNDIRCEYTKKVIELLLWDLAREAGSSVGGAMLKKVPVAMDNTINC
jgi:uncharacterized protein